MTFDILTKNLSQSFNKLDKFPKTRIYSYQSSYSNNNGKKNISKKKIISDGNNARIYKNINGKEFIKNIKFKDLSKELIIPTIKPYNILENNEIIKYKNNNENSNINQIILLLLILVLLIYIAIKLTIKK